MSASLPTYRTIADVLEKKNGSGIRLVGWTIARTGMILPFFLLVGVEPKKAIAGSALASTAISVLTLVRVYNAAYDQAAADGVRSWASAKVRGRGALRGAAPEPESRLGQASGRARPRSLPPLRRIASPSRPRR